MNLPTGLPLRVHCVGVAGGGVSALARLLVSAGHEVSGSDRCAVPAELLSAGVQAVAGPSPQRAAAAEVLVRSAAVPEDDADVVAARAAGVPVLKYAQALGRVLSSRRGLAVAGTHGKSTTTALLAHLLSGAGQDPSWIVGARPVGAEPYGWGQGAHMVVEACEYDHSFLELSFEVALITGMAPDHLDCFGDWAGVVDAFHRFAARLPAHGTLVLGPGVPAGNAPPAPDGARVLDVDAELSVQRAQADARGWTGTLVRRSGQSLPFRLPIWGRHNLDNLRCALVASAAVGVDDADAVGSLSSFGGVQRRLSVRGEIQVEGGSALLVDDFAHHPEALLAAAEALADHAPGRRRVALFQPHQVSRTDEMLSQFVAALQRFDAVGLCDIFVARDARPHLADALASRLAREAGPHVLRLGPAAGADAAARNMLRPGDVCVVMGAGDVDGLARRLGRDAARP